ncbi:MAG: HlyC/CorC family transporter [Acidobacteria bacterium]|uniref:HlyC/CorC family transporter n=1 Tax=Candidatus Sulfomarinibacter kjeldsenii TaxID=2885994 RepID=A0A8J7C345_9BACT|nr:HlyC/CorC family transporter [Candidatus Sulfomarinibacter kjeldsenii]MBD3855923.1 HlyC/CorC family transporter [Candidatus Sulfomarinibacter kjeldsenii]MBD3870095.1 HlyC/CorC family transporter [Candidatus Sulfomarinibacter kjeldsenii]
MRADLAAWLNHPVTVALVVTIMAILFAASELLLRSLAELGNVRFQGILEENPNLFRGRTGVQVSHIIDVGRWLQLALLGGMWLVMWRFPGVAGGEKLAVAIALPVVLISAAHFIFRPLSEDMITVLLRFVGPLATPLVSVLVRRGPSVAPPPPEDDEEEASEAEIQAYLEAGEEAGIFEGEEGEFVESLVDFFDTVVREVMTPRTEMVAVSDETSFRDMLRAFAESHKSRIPVYQETIDRIVGVVHVKNLVEHRLEGGEPKVAELARECLVVPESKPLGELLRDFQQEFQQMAIVVDEYGGTSGLVTLEDILEEIVGEIEDEHDPKSPPEWQEIGPGVYRLQGRALLEVLEELLGVEVDEDDVDTVGGLVFARHGTVPETGTEVVDEIHGLEFTVDEMDERRIVSVTARKMDVDSDVDVAE